VTRFVLRRLALAALVVVGIVVLTFIVARVVPGDPASTWAGPRARPEQIERAREHLGLDRPLPAQVVGYLAGVATGDWGDSLRTRRPVLEDIGRRAPASIELVTVAMLLALAIGVPAGLAAARWRGRAPDLLSRVAAVIGVSMPSFWLAIVLQLVFFQWLDVLPVAGSYDPDLDVTHRLGAVTNAPIVDALLTGNWTVFASAVQHVVLPAIVIAAYPAGVITRMVRASVLDTIGDDHVRMVRALGFTERSVFARFALRHAWSPVISLLALVFAYALVNTFLVEAIFNRPGLGSYAADAIGALDTPAIVGVTLFVALVYVLGNLVVDVAQAAIDPRIRTSRAAS